MKSTKPKTRDAAGEITAITESAAHPAGQSLVFIYVNTTIPGLSWQIINDTLAEYLTGKACLHQAKSGNAILAFRSAHAQRHYQRLASKGQIEMMVLMHETTLWGNQLSEHLISSGLKLHELPVLSNEQERQLLKFLTILAKGSELHVTLQNDATDTASATQSNFSVTTPHIDLP